MQKFYYGKILDEEMDIDTIKELESNAAFYEVNKNTFLNEVQNHTDTQLTLWSLWKNNIKYIEENQERDLYNFSAKEISDLMATIPTVSSDRKASIWSFISQYCSWACNIKGLMNVNPCDSLNREDMIEVNKIAKKNSIIGKHEFFEIIDRLTEETSYTNIIPLILARYGIMGKDLSYMINLKWEDISRQSKYAYIIDHETGEVITHLIIDDKFIELIDKVKAETSKQYNTRTGIKEVVYVDIGYVIKATEKSVKGVVDAQKIYNRLNNVYTQFNMKQIPMGRLEKSRKIEYLLQIRRNRRITTKDVQEVVKIFNRDATGGAYNSLKMDYEAIIEDQVLPARSKDFMLIDNNSNQFVDEIIERFDLWRL